MADIEVTITEKTTKADAVVIEASSTNNEVVSVNSVGAVTVNGKKGTAKIKIEAKASGTAYIVIKTNAAGSDKTNVTRCKITVTAPAKGIVIKSGTLKVNDSGTKKTMELRKGVSGTIEAMLDPRNSTDISKLKITGGKGVIVKNGIISAKSATKEGKPGVITVKCGTIKETIEVTIR